MEMVWVIFGVASASGDSFKCADPDGYTVEVSYE